MQLKASPPAHRAAGQSNANNDPANLAQGISAPPQASPRLTAARRTKLLSYYRPHIGLLIGDLACAVLVSATTLLLPLCANYVVRRLTDGHADPALLGPIYLMGGVMLALIAVQALCTVFIDFQGHMMGAKMETQMRTELFDHYQTLSFSFYDRSRVGQLMSRITNDLFAIGEACHHGPEDLAIAALKFTGALAILFYLDAPMTWLIVALLPFAAAYAVVFNGRMNQALLWVKQRIAAINERVEDSLSGIRVVKSFTGEGVERARFDEANERFLETRRFGYRSEAYFSVGMATFAQLITIIAIVVGAMRITSSSLDVADLLTYLLCVTILVDPIHRLTNVVRVWQEGMTGFNRFMEILDIEPEVRDMAGATALPRVRGQITFQDVSFRYGQESREVLRNLNLQVAAGEFVALIGYSGVGKSTLCSLIPRFYDVTAGQILIDGRDIRSCTLASLRGQIGVVQQDVYLFAGTVAQNLSYGKTGATRDEIIAAATKAHAHDFIMALPHGYDTDIGQRGVTLSGGQKQRLTIARVVLKDPPILIFDEATSALDNESERAIQAALKTLSQDRTTLVIAHRLSTVRHADRIIVLTDEGVAEQGTHDTLMAAGGAYAALYNTQGSL